MRFAGQAVVITGGASGIGAAAAKRFAAEGARIALCDQNFGALEETARGLAVNPADQLLAGLDVADQDQIEAFIAAAAQAFGRLDILVNNAGIGGFGRIDELSVQAWRRVLSVDLDAVFLCCRAALPYLKSSRGAIVNVASISGLVADPGMAAYNAAKAGVINLSRAMALDHAADGVRVNCICPGAVATPMIRAHLRDAEIMAQYQRFIPLGRLAQPEEVAAGICFLASSDASYITGQALAVDGGITAWTGQPNFDVLYRERGWDLKIKKRQEP